MRSLRRATSALVLFVSLTFDVVAVAQPAPDAAPVSMYCVAGDVFVRARPAPAGRRLRRLATGARLQVLAHEGAWTQVALPEQELVGWVLTRSLSTEPPPPPRLSDREIRRILIRASIDAYDGNCPCPYFADAAGRACGRRSAWSREGGESPYCYPADVPSEAVEAWRAEHEVVVGEASAPR